MTIGEVLSEQQCQVESVYDANFIINATDWQNGWFTPIGFCVLTSPTATTALCRTPSICSGNCVVNAVYDHNSRIFTPTVHICDMGYEPSGCIAPCARMDPTTGMCLDIADEPQGTGNRECNAISNN